MKSRPTYSHTERGRPQKKYNNIDDDDDDDGDNGVGVSSRFAGGSRQPHKTASKWGNNDGDDEVDDDDMSLGSDEDDGNDYDDDGEYDDDDDGDDDDVDDEEGGGDNGDDGEEDEGDDEAAEDAAKQLQSQLASVPFHQQLILMQRANISHIPSRKPLGEDGSAGGGRSSKSAAARPSSSGPESTKSKKHMTKEEKELERRRRRRAPKEMTSTKPINLRSVIGEASRDRAKARDPRFDNMCGEFNVDLFRKTYNFVDDYRRKEKTKLLSSLKETKREDLKEKLKYRLSKLDNVMRNVERGDQSRRINASRKKRESDLVEKGKKPYFMKRAEIQKVNLKSKFEELKKSGQLEKYMEKRRRKNAAKDHKAIPMERRQEMGV